MCAEPKSEINFNKESGDFLCFNANKLETSIDFCYEQYSRALVSIVRNILQDEGIDITSYRYKETKNYQKIKNEPISGLPGGSMSFGEFIERFLLDRKDGCYYNSLYDLGNPIEFPKLSDYSDESVTEEIACLLYPNENAIHIADRVIEIKKILTIKAVLRSV